MMDWVSSGVVSPSASLLPYNVPDVSTSHRRWTTAVVDGCFGGDVAADVARDIQLPIRALLLEVSCPYGME